MKKMFLFILLVCSLYANEQETQKNYDLTKDWVYLGCKDALADKWTADQGTIFGMAIAQKDATLDLMRLMSMRTVNGVDVKKVCKWYFNLANDTEFSSKYLQSSGDSGYTFLDIVERSVVQDNGETYEQFTDNLNKIRQLFKK